MEMGLSFLQVACRLVVQTRLGVCLKWLCWVQALAIQRPALEPACLQRACRSFTM